MTTPRLLFVSNLFPNSVNRSKCTFNFQQIKALSRLFQVDVVNPISWTERLRTRNYTKTSLIEGISVRHPTYYFVPKALRFLYGVFYLLSIKRECNRLVQHNGYKAIFASWIFPDCWAAAKIAHKYGLPFYGKVHGTDVNQVRHDSALSRKAVWAVSNAQKFFSVSRGLKESLISIGCAEDKIRVLYNGIDKSVFKRIGPEIALKATVGNGSRFILYVGNFKREKGVGDLLSAYSVIEQKNPGSVRLFFIGSGPFENEMRNFIASNRLSEKVILLGRKDAGEVALWMNASSIVCLPSHSEGMPNVVLEALAVGARVVATEVGGVREIAGAKGLRLVPARNVEALQNALYQLLRSSEIGCLPPMFGSWDDNAMEIAGEILQ